MAPGIPDDERQWVFARFDGGAVGLDEGADRHDLHGSCAGRSSERDACIRNEDGELPCVAVWCEAADRMDQALGYTDDEDQDPPEPDLGTDGA